ncbi:Gustatory receptor 130 [Halyomorpha halys]|nr:Gustatory receptor 130 [Halyomorpha halys]
MEVTKTGTIFSESVEEAFWKLFKMLRIVGLFPMDDRLRLVPRLVLPSAVFLVFIAGTTLYFIFADDRLMIMYGLTHRFLYRLRKLTETITYFLIVYQFCAKKDKLLLILDNLNTVEIFLAPLDQKWAWSLNPIQYIGNICLTFILFVFERSVLPFDLKIAIHFFSMELDLILAATFVNQYCALLDLIKYSLKRVMVSKYYYLYPKMYCLIYDSCEMLNDVYGIIIFSILMVYFVGLLHQFYQLFGVSGKPPMIFFSIICCAAYYGMLLLQIIFAGNDISLETKEFNTTLYNNIVECKLTEMPVYDKLFFHFERSKQFIFSANGFFIVNKSILCTMILTGTTYLVILVQYSASTFLVE